MPASASQPLHDDPLGAWRRRGRDLEIDGRAVFTVDLGPRDTVPWLILHGFPTSSFDFHRVVDRLAADRRVVLHDHLGFGFSDKPADAEYSLFEQADLALGVWRALGIDGGHVLAHDYGTSVATELVARVNGGGVKPAIAIDSLTLSNGSVLIELAKLRPAQRLLKSRVLGPLFARAMTGPRAKRALARLWCDPAKADPHDLEAMWRSIRRADGHLRMPKIIAYLDERRRFRRRWLDALRAFEGPAHILWGRRDPVAVPLIAERLAEAMPDARLTWLEGSGHYPMLETPESWADAARDFLSEAILDPGSSS